VVERTFGSEDAGIAEFVDVVGRTLDIAINDYVVGPKQATELLLGLGYPAHEPVALPDSTLALARSRRAATSLQWWEWIFVVRLLTRSGRIPADVTNARLTDDALGIREKLGLPPPKPAAPVTDGVWWP
jgi:hypothetical protein